MSIHSDPRQNSMDPEERADWERDLNYEYRREIYEQKHPYEFENTECNYQGEDGSCMCDDHCVHQLGKWRDVCGVWEEGASDD